MYFDNGSTTKASSGVRDVVKKALVDHEAPYLAPYDLDELKFQEIDSAINSLYELVGADSADTFHVVSSTDEAIRKVLFEAYLPAVRESGKNHVMALRVEGASILKGIEMVKPLGLEEVLLDVDENGQLTRSELEKKIGPKCGMLMISWVNPLTGVIQPIWEIAEICEKADIRLFVQGSEIFAKLFFQFRDIKIDFLSFEGDKFHGPKGIGGLFVKKGSDYITSADEPHPRFIPALLGLGVAADEVMNYMDTMCTEIARLRGHFESSLEKGVPGLRIIGWGGSRLPTTSVLAIEGIHQELFLFHLAEKGLQASIGGYDQQRLATVLGAMGVDPKLALSAVSFTLSAQTTSEEIERAIKSIREIGEDFKKRGIING